jgi:hypothetical protein
VAPGVSVSPKRSLFALLVGIDQYRHPLTPLRGCVNDIDRAEHYLRSRVDPDNALYPLVLLDHRATRAAVVDGFRRHLAQAGPDDTALFWFSGHGSQMPAPPWWQHVEPTGMVQSLLCSDSRHGGVEDLLDKELAVLIAEVAAHCDHVVAVVDACHSGGVTRDSRGVRVRSVPPATEPPRAEGLLAELFHALPQGTRTATGTGRSDHVLLAACDARGIAYEVNRDRRHGAFSAALLGELGTQGSHATYRELMAGVRVVVEQSFRDQTPILRPAVEPVCDRPFLGGALRSPHSPILMRHVHGRWEVDLGACHGLVPGDDGIRVGVVDGGPTREAEVVSVHSAHSVVAPLDWQPDTARRYPVALTRVPIPRTTVGVVGDRGHTRALVESVVATCGVGGGPSPHLRLVDAPVTPDLLVVVGPGEMATLHQTDGAAVPTATYPAADTDGVRALVADLEQVARWRQIRVLGKPGSGLAAAVRVEVVPVNSGESLPPTGRMPLRPGPDGHLRVQYRAGPGGWIAPEVFVRLHNTTDRWLYCVLLDLTDRFRIHPQLFPGDWIAPRHTVWAAEGGPIELSLPPGRAVAPGASGTDWLKLLITEGPVNSAVFAQPAIDEPRARRMTRLPGLDGVLDGRNGAATNRDLRPVRNTGHDWGTSLVTVVTAIPSNAVRPAAVGR